jgi:hypothetical protein
MTHRSAYDKHWARLAELLGEEAAAAERRRMTADEKIDRQRAKVETFKRQLPRLRRQLAEAEASRSRRHAARIAGQIAYRMRVIAQLEGNETAQPE